MPELPDIVMFCKEAEKALGSKITSIDIKDKQFVKFSTNLADKYLKSKKLTQAMRKGKHLFLMTTDSTGLAFHFGMTGYIIYASQEGDVPKYLKCTINLDDGHAIYFSDKRKLGSIIIADNINEYIKNLHLGPDALEIKQEEFIDKLMNSKTMAKVVLTDQTVISGIGNVYADEILFQARIHPQQKSDKITDAQAENLFHQVKGVLNKAIEKDADVSLLPSSYLLHNRKQGEKCPRCRRKLEIIKISGRTTYFCPECQQKKD